MSKTRCHKQRLFQSICITIILGLGGCSSSISTQEVSSFDSQYSPNDPFENWNRAMFVLDQGLTDIVFRPSTMLYDAFIFNNGRKGVTNILQNFRSPITLANNILQADLKGAGNTTTRFIINSTLGIVGVFDVANRLGFPYQAADLGQTLGIWGINSGPYLYIPILGPTTSRDLAGLAVDNYAFEAMAWIARADNPNWWGLTYGGLVTLDLKARTQALFDELDASSLDFYAAIRSAYMQSRNQLINKGRKNPVQEFDMYEDQDDPFALLNKKISAPRRASKLTVTIE